MPDKDSDYEEILAQNVDDVKSSIRDLEDPDYERLLELEEQGKDRKTIREFLEPKVDDGTERVEDAVDEEVVEEIEEETSQGLLGSFSPIQVAVGGTALGVVIGLIIGFGMAGTSTGMAGEAQVESSLTQLFEASGTDASVSSIETRNGMYYANVSMTREGPNGTVQESSRTFYVSPDGTLLFPEIQSFMVQTPINIPETVSQLEQRQQQTTGESGNGTAPGPNATGSGQ